MGSNTTSTASHEPKCTILHETLTLDLTGLEQSRHLETGFISSMTILSVVFGVMNVAAWSGVSLIACQVPFRHMSCQKNWPGNSRSTASQMQEVSHDLQASFRELSPLFSILGF